MASALPRFKLVFFVPPSALSACKTAIFSAGAGRYPGPGGYTEACFTSKGTGQFRPGDSAKPNVSYGRLAKRPSRKLMNRGQIGKVGELEEVDEYRVEIMCVGRDTAVKAVEALKK